MVLVQIQIQVQLMLVLVLGVLIQMQVRLVTRSLATMAQVQAVLWSVLVLVQL